MAQTSEMGLKQLIDGNTSSGFERMGAARQPEGAGEAHCLWCGRAFTLRMTGGSAQRFCSTGHRQSFWIAARRWTMRAIETGLLSVDCLKAAQASVHAAGGTLRREQEEDDAYEAPAAAANSVAARLLSDRLA